MRTTTEIENPTRRRYHLISGSIVFTTLYAVALMFVRVII